MDNVKHIYIRRLTDLHLVIPSVLDTLEDRTGNWKVIQRKIKSRIDEINGEIYIDGVELVLEKI
jgi:hypothetical protein